MRKPLRFLAICLVVPFLNFCGKEEEKLSPAQKIEMAKNFLEIGLVSDARRLFAEALPETSKEQCKKNEYGKFCSYCDALYGKFLAEFYGTLMMLNDLIKTIRRATQDARLTEEQEELVSQSLEVLASTFLSRIDDQRQDLLLIINDGCAFQSGATAEIDLQLFRLIIPAIPSENRKFTYSPLFAKINYSILSVLAGILDIALSQNFSAPTTRVVALIKRLFEETEKRTTYDIIVDLGDFFAQNPQLLTQNDERAPLMWRKAATDVSDGLEKFAMALEEITDMCRKKQTDEATFTVIEELPRSLNLPIKKLDLCIFLRREDAKRISEVLRKWAAGLSGGLQCQIHEISVGDLKVKGVTIRPNTKDGCIRFPYDIIQAIPILENIIDLIVRKVVTVIIDPAALFSAPTPEKPKNIRALLPLVTEKNGRFVFAIQKEPPTDPFSDLELYTLADGFPRKITESVSFTRKCVPSKTFIPFGDPTFFGSAYYHTRCEIDRTLDIGDDRYAFSPPDLRRGNFALNMAIYPAIERVLR